MIPNFVDISSKTKTWNNSLGVLEIELDSSYSWLKNHYLFLLTTTNLAPSGISNSTIFYFHSFNPSNYILRLIPVRSIGDPQRNATNYNYLFTIPNNERITIGKISNLTDTTIDVKFLDEIIPFNDYVSYFYFVKLYSNKVSQPIILTAGVYYSSTYTITYNYINNGQPPTSNLGLDLDDIVILERIDNYSFSTYDLPNYRNSDIQHKLRNTIFTNTHAFIIGNTTAYFDAWDINAGIYNANATSYNNIDFVSTGKPAGTYNYNLRLDYPLVFVILASSSSSKSLATIKIQYSLNNGDTWNTLSTYYQPYYSGWYSFGVYPVSSFIIPNNINLSNVNLRLSITLPVSTYNDGGNNPNYWIYALRTGKMTAVSQLNK